ncbi:MAG: hypothetical protein ACJ0BN_00530 [Limisphaerales bacterium]|jgi:hypothetical protein|tara:strand:- start:172 stop:336 length:165 start_codon:yes stop_codon:yes gene_type:complete
MGGKAIQCPDGFGRSAFRHASPGEREQTKLALALPLAMIEEFEGLRFFIFDETT